MKTLNVLVLVVAATLAACKKKEDTGAAPAGSAGSAGSAAGGSAGSAGGAGSAAAADTGPPAECKDAAKNYNKLFGEDPTSILGSAPEGMKGLMKYSYEEHCDQAWSQAQKNCVAKATTSAMARACFDSQTLNFLDEMTKAEMADMAKNKAENDARKAAEAGSAAAGSGSAVR